MAINFFRHSFRASKVFFEILAIGATVFVLAAVLLFWRLAQSPFDVSFARPYIETALADRETGFAAQLPKVVLSWPDLRGPLMLSAEQVTVTQGGRPVFHAAHLRLGLSTLFLLAGQIVPTTLELTAPTLDLNRQPDNAFVLGLAPNPAAPPVADAPPALTGDLYNVFRILSRPRHWLSRRSPIENLQRIHIVQAQLSFADLQRDVHWQANDVDITCARVWDGLSVTVQTPLNNGVKAAGNLRVQLHYRRPFADFKINTRFEEFNPQPVIRELQVSQPAFGTRDFFLTGTAQAHMDQNFRLLSGNIQTSTAGALLILPDFYSNPVRLSAGDFAARYEATGKGGRGGTLVVNQLTLKTGDAVATLSAPLVLADGRLRGKFALAMPFLPERTLLEYWPDHLFPGLKSWLAQRFSGGSIRDFNASGIIDLTRGPDGKWRHTIEGLTANFNLAGIKAGTTSSLAGDMGVQTLFRPAAPGQTVIEAKVNAVNANLALPAFGYFKKAGMPLAGQARFLFTGGLLSRVDSLSLNAADLKLADGVLSFAPTKVGVALRSADLPKVQCNETRARVGLTHVAPGSWQLNIRGPFVDATPFLAHSSRSYDGPAFSAHIVADQMRTNQQAIIRQADITIGKNNDHLINSLLVHAVVGTGALNLQLNPDARGLMRLHLRAEDAGAVLRAFNIYNHALGGILQIDGAAEDPAHPRDIAGVARMRDFREVQGPVMARIISAISPLSLLKSFEGDGIGFSLLESHFVWSMRPGGDLYTVTDGRTEGNSLGLTFAGTIDRHRDAVALTGDVIPLSGVNGLVSHIPLIGHLLAGGKNSALFAATYTVSGPVHAPEVTVNPLSMLTPGILRRIIFGQ